MVFVKVRETYDLRTVQNKMSIIGIHTPEPILVARNFPGLLMNCKFYRPVSADVTIACASMLPADPLQVGVAPGEIAPEDLFNPILYKACTNESFSLLESRILALVSGLGDTDVSGNCAKIETDNAVPDPPNGDPIDDFRVYYGLLSDAHGWRHANPQSGLSMRGLKPLVHEVLASFGGVGVSSGGISGVGSSSPSDPIYSPTENIGSGGLGPIAPVFMRGNTKVMPRLPTTLFPMTNSNGTSPGFNGIGLTNKQEGIPRMRTMVAAICIPPSRLHELYYRMVVEWTLEFTEIRTLSEIAGWAGLASLGDNTRFANYDFGDSKTMDKETAMVDANIDIEKVM